MGWQIGSETMVGVCGILLGIDAAVMAIILGYVRGSDLAGVTLALLAMSLGVFLLAAEKFSEALDFDDRKRHLSAIKLYNVAVVLLLWGVAILVVIFGYLIPTSILVLFSLYWIREIVRTTLLARRRASSR